VFPYLPPKAVWRTHHNPVHFKLSTSPACQGAKIQAVSSFDEWRPSDNPQQSLASCVATIK